MTPRERAEKVYCQYWEDVNKKNIKPDDPLPDIRPLLAQAIESAVLEEREECAKIAEGHIFTSYIETSADLREEIAKTIRARK